MSSCLPACLVSLPSSMEPLYEFTQKYDTQSLGLYSSAFWSVSLRPNQATYGALLLYLNKPMPSIFHLTQECWLDYADVYSHCLQSLHVSLNPVNVNTYQLMLIDPHVHFHIFPRFKPGLLTDDDYPLDPYGFPNPVSDLSHSVLKTQAELLTLRSSLLPHFS